MRENDLVIFMRINQLTEELLIIANKTTPLKLVSLASIALFAAACGDDAANNGENGAEASLGEDLDYTITGIEPGAGISENTRDALEDYENLSGWEHQESSTAGMMTQLDQAIQNEEPIVVTGWIPHHKFEMHDLKFLEDPENSYGGAEDIHTMAREGLAEDMPEAYEILGNFTWEIEDMQSIVMDAQEMDFDAAADIWINENQDKIAEWTEGVDQVNGDSIEIVSFPWDTERASSEVIAYVLENHGFDVTVTNVDPAIMFQALASGETDATIAPWLPTTQGAFYEQYGDSIDDLGPNMSGTQIGLVVPEYMDIDSIEDLPAGD